MVKDHTQDKEFIQAFWFGLTNPVLTDGKTCCDLWVSDSIHFDSYDPMGARTHLDPTFYLPEGCYAQSAIQDRMYYLIHQHEAVEPGEYMLCLGYACLAIRSAYSQIEKHLLYGFSSPRPIAVGSDNGDLLHIEKISDRPIETAQTLHFICNLARSARYRSNP